MSRILVFAKAPESGKVKTRLIPVLGAGRAALLARHMLIHSLTEALDSGVDRVELCASPVIHDPSWKDIYLPSGLLISDQGSGDLGERLSRASQRALLDEDSIFLIGTDCPDLDSARLLDAIRALEDADVVMIPANDGGYTLLGLKRFHASLFEGISWSTATVAQETEERVQALAWRLTKLPPLPDIDEPRDLKHLPKAWLL